MADTSGIRAGRAYVELALNDSKFLQALNSSMGKLQSFGEGVKGVGQQIEGVGFKMAALGTGIVTPLVAAAVSFSHTGDELNKMSQKTGITVEALSEMKHAAIKADVSMESLGGGIRHMQRTLVEAAAGSDTAVAALGKLGFTAKDLQALKPDEQFEVIGQALLAIPDPAQRAAEAMAIFGRSGVELIPLMTGLGAAREEAVRFGETMTTTEAEAASKLDDGIKVLLETVGKLKDAIGSALAPTLTEWAEKARVLVTAGIAWVKQNEEIIVSTLKSALQLAATGVAIVVFGKTLIVTGSAVSSFIKTMKKLQLLFIGTLGPVGAITAAIGLMGIAAAAAIELHDKIGDAGQELADFADALKNVEVKVDTTALDVTSAKYKAIIKLQEEWMKALNPERFPAIPAPAFTKAFVPNSPEQEAAIQAKAKARAEREAADRASPNFVETRRSIPLRQQLSKTFEVMGTFSAAAVNRQGLGGTLSVQQEIKSLLELANQHIEETKKIEDQQLTELKIGNTHFTKWK